MAQQLRLLALFFEAKRKLGVAQRLRRLAGTVACASSAADETSGTPAPADKSCAKRAPTQGAPESMTLSSRPIFHRRRNE